MKVFAFFQNPRPGEAYYSRRVAKKSRGRARRRKKKILRQNRHFEAEKFLQRAVELLPRDPIINDHYADNLWMLKKTIQARYIWKSLLKLDKAEQELKDQVKKKLIFGITNKL